MFPSSKLFASIFASCVVVGSLGAQQFVDNTTSIPSGGPDNASRTESVDFADVDLDGDWDAAFADGGDGGNDQNRLWINQGMLQTGALGTFVDETSARFPSVQDTSRDVEFVDIDGDGDVDLHSSNTSSLILNGNRWWVNVGGLQAGNLGFYVDETSARWVGLGTAGSSVAASHVLPTGGFIDWTSDSDFGDLDNDGDMDLVHSSYGGAFVGLVPTRIFLNDGAGFFSELNLTSFQLAGSNISNGNPGLWCEGLQQEDTSDSTGMFCDIASRALDIDVGDTDGDFDLDLIHGHRQGPVRMFQNRLEEEGGDSSNLVFRDVTSAVFPAGYVAPGAGTFEQEMGDLDGDGDLDVYGVSFGNPFIDRTLPNDGNGVFTSFTDVPASNHDAEEADFIDYDLDGDLDVVTANFAGNDHLFQNQNNGGATFSFVSVTAATLPALNFTGKDPETCDVDGDGDYDVFMANDAGARNVFYENMLNPIAASDGFAPVIPNLEQVPDRMPGPEPTAVRAHVYDNAPYYITYFNPTTLEYSSGGSSVQVPMQSSGGQVFRGEIPGTLTGTITYRVISGDQYGNVGMSTQLAFLSGTDDFCFGDGGVSPGCTACPCGNDTASGANTGCINSGGTGARILRSGTPSAANDTLRFDLSGASPSTFAVLVSADNQLPNTGPCPPGSGIQSFTLDGLRCVGGNLLRHGTRATDANGDSTNPWGPPGNPPGGILAQGGFTLGQVRSFQTFYREAAGQVCLTGVNTSHGTSVTVLP